VYFKTFSPYPAWSAKPVTHQREPSSVSSATFPAVRSARDSDTSREIHTACPNHRIGASSTNSSTVATTLAASCTTTAKMAG
jgi:hypothetical protein